MSATQQAIDFIRKQGAARTDAIAKAIGKPSEWVAAALNGPVRDGLLVMCKVSPNGGRPMNEYRMSASGKPVGFTPLSARGRATAAIGPVPPTPVPVSRPAPPVVVQRPANDLSAKLAHKANGVDIDKVHAAPLDRKSVYAVALTDLRAKRDYHAGEVAKIDTAIAAVEALG